jgi:signal peptidase I
MEDTLYEKENLIVSDLFYTPKRGDVIVFHQTGALNEPIVKRVIATEGETVSIVYKDSSMQITVTDLEGQKTVLEEEYVKYVGFPLYQSPVTLTVPEDSLFVLGDNRNVSKDSRHSDIGMVDERRVLGKVLFRVTPFDRLGTIE